MRSRAASASAESIVGLGSRARFVTKFLGRRIENESEVTEFEPNRRFTADAKSGPFPFRIAMTFTPVDPADAEVAAK